MSKYFTRKRNDTRDITTRIHDDLKRFRKLFCENHTSFKFRLKVLKKYANKIYLRVEKKDLKRLRKRFKNEAVKSYVKLPKCGCALCETSNAEARHHVVQLQYGGFKGGSNVVFLCNNCHALIHPWLH